MLVQINSSQKRNADDPLFNLDITEGAICQIRHTSGPHELYELQMQTRCK